MIKFTNHPTIGYGVYTVSEAATLLGLPTGKVRYWLNKFWDERLQSDSYLKYSWGEGRGKAVNFYTLIEFFIFYHLRKSGVPASRILKSHQFLAKEFGVAYPFAVYKIMTDGKSILFSADQGESIASADKKLQYNIPGIIKDFVQKIEFEKGSDLAERFFPDGKQSAVVVDPKHQLGQPVIQGTNILARSIYSLHKGGETTDFIASLYQLNSKQVHDAIAFYKKAEAA